MNENWKDIPSYKGLYQASNQGRIRSLDRKVWNGHGYYLKHGRVLKPSKDLDGYYHVNLFSGNKPHTYKVCALVAITWIGVRPKNYDICHGVNGRQDDSLLNLTYGTKSQNMLDCRRDGHKGFSPVRRSDGKEFINMNVAMEETKCSNHIWDVCVGKRKSCGGFGWEYI